MTTNFPMLGDRKTLVQPRFEWDDVALAEGRKNAQDMFLAKEVAGVLFGAYPDHDWYVAVDGEAGSITIKNLSLSAQYGYLLHYSKTQAPGAIHTKVINAGGEILERFGVRRGRYSEGDYNGLIDKSRTAKGD